MKVIFIKDLKKVAKKNEVKEVSDGYGINYLIKNGYAVKYTKTSGEILTKQIQKDNEIEQDIINKSHILKDKLEKEKLKFYVSLGNNGKIFGSVTSKQISDKLNEIGYNISKKDVLLKENLCKIGSNVVEVFLYKNIIAKIEVILMKK